MDLNSRDLLNLIRTACDNEFAFTEVSAARFMEIGRIGLVPQKIRILTARTRTATLLIPLDAPLYAYENEKDKKPREVYEIGSFLGLAQALTLSPFPYDVFTKTDTHILSIPVSHIRSLVDHDASLRWQLINYIAYLLEDKQPSASVIQSHPASRLANFFVDMTHRYGIAASEGYEISYKLSQEEIGQRIGASRQTVNKYIQELIEIGYLKKKGNQYVALNLEGLKNFNKNM